MSYARFCCACAWHMVVWHLENLDHVSSIRHCNTCELSVGASVDDWTWEINVFTCLHESCSVTGCAEHPSGTDARVKIAQGGSSRCRRCNQIHNWLTCIIAAARRAEAGGPAKEHLQPKHGCI